MKNIIARDYEEVSSAKEMKRIVWDIWESFEDRQ